MRVDKFGVVWDVSLNELCSTCGQPDNCGDCNHRSLSDKEIKELGGIRFTHVVIAGTISRGFEAYGAFISEDAADQWIEAVEKHSYSGDYMATIPIERAE